MLAVTSKSIGIHLHLPMIADGIGVPLDKLRLVQNHAGGTFGYKFSPTNEAILGVAALVCQRPVSLNFNMYSPSPTPASAARASCTSSSRRTTTARCWPSGATTTSTTARTPSSATC